MSAPTVALPHGNERRPASPYTYGTQAEADIGAAGRAAETLTQLDNAKLSMFHLKTILIAGSGFMCDGYDLQCIGMITNLMGRIYYPDWTYYPPSKCAAMGAAFNAPSAASVIPGYLLAANQANNPKYQVCGSNYSKLVSHQLSDAWQDHVPSALPLSINFAINGVALCGTVTGQLLFGFLGDKLGRKSMFVASLMILIIFAFMQGLTLGAGAPAFIWSLCWFRFLLGVGIGGEYPLSATFMSEFGGKSNRGALVAAVFSMQGTGYLLASAFVAIMSLVWRATNANPDYLWRVVLMFGCVPAVLTMWSRVQMPETPRYTLFNAGQADVMVDDMHKVLVDRNATFHDVNVAGGRGRGNESRLVGRIKTDSRTYPDFFRQYGLILVGTAGAWFFQNIAFYSQGLYQNVIYQNIGWVPASYLLTPADEALQLAKAQTYVNLASTIPGYWVTVFTIEYLGRWKIQMGGFLMMTLFMSLLAGLYDTLYYNVPVFIALYCMTFFFANWGPNATTFVVPAEVFPAKFRTFGHGVSAATGKVGSVIGVFGFKYMTLYTGGQLAARGSTPASQSLGPALGLLAGCLGMGALVTLLVPESAGKSLEELGADVAVNAPLVHLLKPGMQLAEEDGLVKGNEPAVDLEKVLAVDGQQDVQNYTAHDM